MKAQTHPIEKEQVMAYLDGELSPEAAARVASHLTECSDCRALEAAMRGVSLGLLAWNVEPSSALLSHGVNSVLRAENLATPRKQNQRITRPSSVFHRVVFSRWTWASACGVAVLLIGWKAFGPRPAVIDSLNQAELTGYLERKSLSSSLANSVAPQPAAPPAGEGLYTHGEGGGDGSDKLTVAPGPMIARTASLKISVKDFDSARANLERIVRAHGGYAASMTVDSQKNEARSLDAELEIPAPASDAAIADFKALGRVEQERQGGEEVTAQVMDLDARLKNARITETRLEEILRTRTGKVGDVLEVEKEMASVRGEIEQMEGEQKALHNRVTYNYIQLHLHEEYAASLDVGSSSVSRRVRNAVVDGFSAAMDGFLSLGLFLLYLAPSLILLGLILFWPARWAWRRLHQAQGELR